jgi:hypothetical protein
MRLRAPQRAPRLFHSLAVTWWGIPVGEAWRLWHALEKAQFEVGVSLRQRILLAPTVDIQAFRQTTTPQTVIEALESLHQERLLSRKDTTTYQEYVLRQMHHSRWT